MRFKKIMKNFLGTLLLISGITLFAFSSQAEEIVIDQDNESQGMKMIVVANVSIENFSIVSQNNNNLKLFFNIINGEKIQPDIKYGIQLIKEEQEEQSQIIVDEKIYSEKITLNENDSKIVEIEYQAPSYLYGDYSLWLVVKNSSGLILGLARQDVSLDGNGNFVEILSSSCILKVQGEDNDKEYLFWEGVSINSQEKLIGVCNVVNHFDKVVNTTAYFSIYLRSIFGDKLKDISALEQEFSFNQKEQKNISFTLPTDLEPQAYDAVFTLKDSNDKIISNKINFHYVIQGASATIQNIRTDKESYNKGETAKISFFWSGSADRFPDSRTGGTQMSGLSVQFFIKDENSSELCGELIYNLQAEESYSFEVDIPIINECKNPIVSSLIKDEQGNILDQKEFIINSQKSSLEEKISKKELYIFLGFSLVFFVLIVIIFWIIKKIRLSKNT